MANVVGGVLVLVVSAIVPLAVARGALTLIMALMAHKDAEPDPAGLGFRTVETREADPASAR